MAHCVVLSEGMILAIVSCLAWSSRKSWLLFPFGVLLSMAMVAFLHDSYFLVTDARHAGQEWGMLAGFGLAAALCLGLPLGTILGAFILLTRKYMSRIVRDGERA